MGFSQPVTRTDTPSVLLLYRKTTSSCKDDLVILVSSSQQRGGLKAVLVSDNLSPDHPICHKMYIHPLPTGSTGQPVQTALSVLPELKSIIWSLDKAVCIDLIAVCIDLIIAAC